VRDRIEIRRRQAGMDVCVDQSRHDGLSAAVDAASFLHRDRLLRDFPDPIVLDQNVARLGEIIVDAVVESAVLENRHGHGQRPG
jgi:hypothetical protein